MSKKDYFLDCWLIKIINSWRSSKAKSQFPLLSFLLLMNSWVNSCSKWASCSKVSFIPNFLFCLDGCKDYPFISSPESLKQTKFSSTPLKLHEIINVLRAVFRLSGLKESWPKFEPSFAILIFFSKK